MPSKKKNYAFRTFRRMVANPSLALKSALGNASLTELGRIYGTDKVNELHTYQGLTYMDIYEKYLEPIQNEEANLMEIGVREGESLRTWEAYFSKGRICGIDIDPRCKEQQKGRVEVEIGSQDDPDFLKTCFGEDTKFDIIIDDGSHVNTFTIASFKNLFESRLKSGGIYIIEDLACSYDKLQTEHNIVETWPGMKHNDPSQSLDNDRKDLDVFFQEKIKALDHLQGNILTIHFWAMTCVIIKV
jgi:hypothetical protein